MNIEKIKEILKEKNLNIHKLSLITGISRGNLSQMMNGKYKRIELLTAIKIANALDVSLDEIVDRNI